METIVNEVKTVRILKATSKKYISIYYYYKSQIEIEKVWIEKGYTMQTIEDWLNDENQ